MEDRASCSSMRHKKTRRPCLDLLFVYCMICILLVVVYSLVKDRRDTQLPIGIVISCSLMNITKLIWIKNMCRMH